MKFRKNYNNKCWFEMIRANSSACTMFGRGAIRMLADNPVFKDMYVNVKPRCWRG